MDNLDKLISFLEKLESEKFSFKLDKIRDSILVEVYVPGQRWEIEFMQDGEIQIEIYKSEGRICGEEMLEVLFRDF
jgi:hypothetical protein